jgi:hypothetical protein
MSQLCRTATERASQQGVYRGRRAEQRARLVQSGDSATTRSASHSGNQLYTIYNYIQFECTLIRI